MPCGSGRRSPWISSSAGRPASRTRSTRVSELADPRLRRATHDLALVAEGAKQPTQLGHRLPTGGLDGKQRLLGLVGRGADDLPRGPRLDEHHADRVCHPVVELARDVPALLRDGRLQPGLALACARAAASAAALPPGAAS